MVRQLTALISIDILEISKIGLLRALAAICMTVLALVAPKLIGRTMAGEFFFFLSMVMMCTALLKFTPENYLLQNMQKMPSEKALGLHGQLVTFLAMIFFVVSIFLSIVLKLPGSYIIVLFVSYLYSLVIVLAVFFKNKNMDLIAIAMQFVVFQVCVFLLVYLFDSIVLGFILGALCAFGSSCSVFRRFRGTVFMEHISWRVFKKYFLSGRYYWGNSFVIIISSWSPLFIIGLHFDKEILSDVNVLIRICALVSFTAIAIGYFVTRKLAQENNFEYEFLIKLLRKMSLYGVVSGVLITPIAYFIQDWYFSSQYTQLFIFLITGHLLNLVTGPIVQILLLSGKGRMVSFVNLLNLGMLLLLYSIAAKTNNLQYVVMCLSTLYCISPVTLFVVYLLKGREWQYA